MPAPTQNENNLQKARTPTRLRHVFIFSKPHTLFCIDADIFSAVLSSVNNRSREGCCASASCLRRIWHMCSLGLKRTQIHTKYVSKNKRFFTFYIQTARNDENRVNLPVLYLAVYLLPKVVLLFCVLQEVEKARQDQESVLRDLRTKSEADRAAHAEEIERLKVGTCIYNIISEKQQKYFLLIFPQRFLCAT